MPTTTPTIFYLTRRMKQPDGEHLNCSQLYQTLERQYPIANAYMVVSAAEQARMHANIAATVFTEEEILAHKRPILIVEGNLGQMVDMLDYPTSPQPPRISPTVLRQITAQGGIVVLMLMGGSGKPEAYNRFHQAAGMPSLYVTRNSSYIVGSGPEGKAPTAVDIAHRKNYDGSIFEVVLDSDYITWRDQWLDSPFQAIYANVERYLLSSALPLEISGVKSFLVGNKTTQFLASDWYVDTAPPVFGTLAQTPAGGASVLITGAPLHDSTLAIGASDAVQLFMNLLQHLQAA